MTIDIKAVSERKFTTEDATGVNGDKMVGNYHQDPDDPVMNPSDLTYRGIYKDAGSAAFGLLGNETVEELAAHAIGNTDPASANFDPLPDPVFGLGRHIELGAASEAGVVTAHAARAKGVLQEVVTRLVAMGQSGERMGGLRSKVGTITIEFGNPADSSQVLNDCHILFQKIHVPHTPGNEAVLGVLQDGWMDDRTRANLEASFCAFTVMGLAETKSLYQEVSGPLVGVILEMLHNMPVIHILIPEHGYNLTIHLIVVHRIDAGSARARCHPLHIS